MNVAVGGKGGTGKTTIVAAVARIAARTGRTAVAVDADSNPNLATALGYLATEPHALPASVVSRRLGGPALTEPVDAVIERHGASAPDGVRMLVMGAPGHADEGCMCSAHATVSALLAELRGRPDTFTVVDLEASPEHFSRGTARHADVMLLAAEPYYRSLETVRRMAVLAAELQIPRTAVVANKVRSEADRLAVSEFCVRHGLELVSEIPWDDAVMQADRDRLPLVDAAPNSPALRAAAALVHQLSAPR